MDCYYYCVKMIILQKVMYRFKTITIKEIGKPYRRGGRNKCRVRGRGGGWKIPGDHGPQKQKSRLNMGSEREVASTYMGRKQVSVLLWL